MLGRRRKLNVFQHVIKKKQPDVIFWHVAGLFENCVTQDYENCGRWTSYPWIETSAYCNFTCSKFQKCHFKWVKTATELQLREASRQNSKWKLQTWGDSFRLAGNVILLSPKTSTPPFLSLSLPDSLGLTNTLDAKSEGLTRKISYPWVLSSLYVPTALLPFVHFLHFSFTWLFKRMVGQTGSGI